MGKLTVKGVAALTAPGRYSDDGNPGFHLRIDAQGRKYWVQRTQVDGKRKDVSLGPVSKIALSAAREMARRVREQVASNSKRPLSCPTFAEAAKLAHTARTVGYANAKHRAQWLSTLETYAVPTMGGKAVDQVTRADVVKALAPIWLTKPETARRTLQRIDRVMRWAVGHNHRDTLIDMSLVRDALPPQNRSRESVRRMPAMAADEVAAFWSAVRDSSARPETRLGLGLLIHTAVRPGNIASAKRGQFDLDAGVWSIPATEMKSKVAFRVPLVPAVVTLVCSAMALHDRDLLFSLGSKPMSGDTLRIAMRRMGRTEVPHGFRSTFKEWTRSAGWADHLSEAALAHQDPNEVRAAYARSDLLEERRPMMQAWAEHVAGSPHNRAGP